MRSRCWLSLALVLALAACGNDDRQQTSLRQYDYDSSVPLAYHDFGVVNHDYPVKIHDVSYLGAGHRVFSYLLLPPHRSGRHPAVVFLHGAGGTRLDLIPFAARLSLRGVVTMALGERAPNEYAPMVIDVRRALDLLAARPDVDPKRLGVVGYSLGGQVAAIVAGVDSRPTAVGIIAGRGTAEARDAVAHAKAALFFQAGTKDAVVPHDELEALIDAAPAGHRKVKWYAAGHEMGVAAFDEQVAWQAAELGPP